MSQSRFIIKLKVLLPHALVTVADFAILCRPFDFIALKTLNYLAFQSFDFEHTTWWRLFQKRVVRTKFDINVYHNDQTLQFAAFYDTAFW
jgi:hypothetical protein